MAIDIFFKNGDEVVAVYKDAPQIVVDIFDDGTEFTLDDIDNYFMEAMAEAGRVKEDEDNDDIFADDYITDYANYLKDVEAWLQNNEDETVVSEFVERDTDTAE